MDPLVAAVKYTAVLWIQHQRAMTYDLFGMHRDNIPMKVCTSTNSGALKTHVILVSVRCHYFDFFLAFESYNF